MGQDVNSDKYIYGPNIANMYPSTNTNTDDIRFDTIRIRIFRANIEKKSFIYYKKILFLIYKYVFAPQNKITF